MTDQHTADTDYDQQYEQHGNGEFHHAPPPAQADIPASLVKLSEPTPRQPIRAWPLAARLAVAVLIIGLATIAAGSLISLQTVSKRATQASVMASAEAGTVARLGSQLQALQTRVAVPVPAPKPYRPPAVLQHYGMCVSFGRDTSTGALVNVNLTTPTVSGGSVNCSQGTLVSVVPAP
jgi:hypothetical protein